MKPTLIYIGLDVDDTQFYAKGLLTFVNVPEAQTEQDRDLPLFPFLSGVRLT